MPKIEIDETEYAEYKRVYEVASLLEKNPEARTKLQEAIAIAAPERAGAEIRMKEHVDKRLKGIEDRFTEFLDAQKKEREERTTAESQRQLEQRWLAGRKVARDGGYTDDGLEKLETFMEKHGIADHSLAIPAFERENPPPEPVSTGASAWNFFDQRDNGFAEGALKDLMDGNDEAFLAKTITPTLRDMRNGR